MWKILQWNEFLYFTRDFFFRQSRRVSFNIFSIWFLFTVFFHIIVVFLSKQCLLVAKNNCIQMMESRHIWRINSTFTFSYLIIWSKWKWIKKWKTTINNTENLPLEDNVRENSLHSEIRKVASIQLFNKTVLNWK